MNTKTLILLSTIAALLGCKSGGIKQNPAPGSSPAGSASTRPAGPQKPVGIYEISEIEHDGRVDIRGPANEAITLTLFPNGSYSRRVENNGKTHLDQGDFHIEGDELV